ncbi:DUF7287 family protein [Methanolobus profundi]|uniref:Uncharacterized protein n=1 Tax=Methanolobus profundi TaxID=487685 RepID=A0A1I4SRY1_9EURY|nr:hypothetical protein [Methanolobus profundi]SFM67063.1 hypothetical protein SAMN04488696_1976 [Methanolobus profundi]
MKDESGQIAVDFLLGISLVLIALSFTMQFVPGLFTSGSAGESSLDYTAYRTATILVEDTGWWEHSTGNGTDWETHTSDLMRIGLAVDDEPGTRLTNVPNLISKDKIGQFMLLDESIMVEVLGLYNNVDGSRFAYGYNISITKKGAIINVNNTAITRGTTVPDDQEIAKISRIVLIEHGTTAVLKGDSITSSSSSKATVNITGPFEENITIQLQNLNISGVGPAFVNASLDGAILTQPADMTIYRLEGWDHSPFSGSLNGTDVICFNIDNSLFNMGTEYRIDLEFSNVTFNNTGTSFVNYNNISSPLYEPAYLTVEVWQ